MRAQVVRSALGAERRNTTGRARGKAGGDRGFGELATILLIMHGNKNFLRLLKCDSCVLLNKVQIRKSMARQL